MRIVCVENGDGEESGLTQPFVFPKPGTIVQVTYKDHVFFRDAYSPSLQAPRTMEAVGKLDEESDDSIRLIWEEYPEPTATDAHKMRATGLTILKSTIVAVRKVSQEP